MRSCPDRLLTRVLACAHALFAQGLRPDLDQCPATLSTVLRRLKFLAPRRRDILLMGDDDLLGLGLAAARTRSRIVVLDADEKVLHLVGQYAPKGTVELVQHDLHVGLPAALRHRFDEVFTDPPYTLAGQLLFIHRAMTALRTSGRSSLYVCASRVYLTGEEIAMVREFLSRGGFELQAMYPRFNHYPAPPDVRRDLEKRGWRRTALFHSDLMHYVRRRVARVPRIPRAAFRNIYAYHDYFGKNRRIPTS